MIEFCLGFMVGVIVTVMVVFVRWASSQIGPFR